MAESQQSPEDFVLYELKAALKIESKRKLKEPDSNPTDSKPHELATDTRYAWFICLVVFIQHIGIFGVGANTFGIFQKAYSDYLGTEYGPTSFVGSLGGCLLGFGGAIIGPTSKRIGYRKCSIIGALCISAGLLISSYCTELWQLYLSHGVLYGVGASLSYISCMSVLTQWFKVKKSTAFGFATAGSGFSGAIMSPILLSLINHYGIQITLRIISAGVLIVMTTCSMFLKDRYSHTVSNKKIFDWGLFKEPRLKYYFITWIFVGLSLLSPYYFILSYAIDTNIGESAGLLSLSLLNISSIFGRIIISMFADKFGAINMAIYIHIVATLSLIVWLFSTTEAVLITFAVIFGFHASATIALIPSILSDWYDEKRVSSAFGTILTSISFGYLLGGAIFGYIVDNTGTYNYAIINISVLFLISTIFIFITKLKSQKI